MGFAKRGSIIGALVALFALAVPGGASAGETIGSDLAGQLNVTCLGCGLVGIKGAGGVPIRASKDSGCTARKGGISAAADAAG